MAEIPETAWCAHDGSWPVRLGTHVRDRPILDTIRDAVAQHGDRIAVQDRQNALNFRELWGLAGGMAKAIRGTRAGPGPVAIALPADATYFPAILACLAAGRMCVLLDATAPAARNLDLLTQIGAALALEPPGGHMAKGVARLSVGIDTPPEDMAWTASPDPDAPAIVLCTSGSSGRPKAIVQSQRTVMHRALCQSNAIGTEAGDLCLSLSPPSTLGGLACLLVHAINGCGTMFMDVRAVGFAGMLETLLTQPVTSLRAAPSLLRAVVGLEQPERFLARLRNITLISEPVPRADVAALRQILPVGTTLFTAYGSTESGSIGWHPAGDDAYDAVRTPAGRLMPGFEAAILDEDGRPCAVDEAGELVLRSRYNALGEWRDGRVVAGQLAPDPQNAALRVHRTGDLARRSADGVYTVLGRRDRMLKLNGQRVEPGEIEAAIRRQPSVEDCAVVAKARGASQSLAAYVVLRPGIAAGALDDLRSSVREQLPAAMMPSRFTPLQQLPRLVSGKIDYRALETL